MLTKGSLFDLPFAWCGETLRLLHHCFGMKQFPHRLVKDPPDSTGCSRSKSHFQVKTTKTIQLRYAQLQICCKALRLMLLKLTRFGQFAAWKGWCLVHGNQREGNRGFREKLVRFLLNPQASGWLESLRCGRRLSSAIGRRLPSGWWT